jgi:hypothetical protein
VIFRVILCPRAKAGLRPSGDPVESKAISVMPVAYGTVVGLGVGVIVAVGVADALAVGFGLGLGLGLVVDDADGLGEAPAAA